MSREPKPFYRVYCKYCGETEETDYNTDAFFDQFFMPERCPCCHEHMGGKYARFWEERGWVVDFGYWHQEPHDFDWHKPSTWRNPNPVTWISWDERS